jgi:hypothetical protein
MMNYLRKLPQPARSIVKVLLLGILVPLFAGCLFLGASVLAGAMLEIYAAIAGPAPKSVPIIAFAVGAGIAVLSGYGDQYRKELKARGHGYVKWLSRAYIVAFSGCLTASSLQRDIGPGFWATFVALLSLSVIVAYGPILVLQHRKLLHIAKPEQTNSLKAARGNGEISA